jgi:RHS repeat-associated protein
MPLERAAMLYRTLPHTPMMPGPMAQEKIARMAGEPVDPMQSVFAAQGQSPNQISAQNDQMIQQSMRDRFGPIYVPPLHRDHNHAAEPAMAASSTRLVQAHQGSIREMTDDNGNIVAQYAYDPFGVPTKLQGSMDSDFQFAGYYYHASSGLYLTTNRAYSPVLGRFLSRDPIGESAGTNLYAYVHSNPISYIDPLGLDQVYVGYSTWDSGTIVGPVNHSAVIITDDNGNIIQDLGLGPVGPSGLYGPFPEFPIGGSVIGNPSFTYINPPGGLTSNQFADRARNRYGNVCRLSQKYKIKWGFGGLTAPIVGGFCPNCHNGTNIILQSSGVFTIPAAPAPTAVGGAQPGILSNIFGNWGL